MSLQPRNAAQSPITPTNTTSGPAGSGSGASSNKSNANNITYNDIASKLLEDRFLLTALELHTELIEAGREIRQLRDFFSNPGNFEYQNTTLANYDSQSRISRSESQATLDSLDWTRCSEDGTNQGDEKIAVLEFELRKARETISALRNNLTVATESENNTPEKRAVDSNAASRKNSQVVVIKPHEQRALNFLINEYMLQYGYKLTSITFADENQNQDFDDWDDVGLNIPKPPELLSLYRDGLKQQTVYCQNNAKTTATQTDHSYDDYEPPIVQELKSKLVEIEAQLKESEAKSKSNSPCTYELIEDEEETKHSDDSSFNDVDWTNLTSAVIHDSTHVSITTNHNHEDGDEEEGMGGEGTNGRSDVFDRVAHSLFLEEVFRLCYAVIPGVARENVDLIDVVTHSLPRIVPNVILNKREEVVPLLTAAILANPKAGERDKLLQLLFNLKKKPSEEERVLILKGLVEIAKFSGEQLVENEILPQCWEQMTHKHVEKRLLVAEACTALIPYVSNSIRNSLILSMLQQMLDDRDEIVLESVIRALALLIALMDDTSNKKYSQCEELVLETLHCNKGSTKLFDLGLTVLVPVLGKWALVNGEIRTSLLKNLLHRLNGYLKSDDVAHQKVENTLTIIDRLLPFLLVSIATASDDVMKRVGPDMVAETKRQDGGGKLVDPAIFYDRSAGVVLYEFGRFVAERPECGWAELDWIVDFMIPDLLNNINHIDSSTHRHLVTHLVDLFTHISVQFGPHFTRTRILPILQTQIDGLEQILLTFTQFFPNLNIIPVFIVSVLAQCTEDPTSEVPTKNPTSEVVQTRNPTSELVQRNFQKFLFALPTCGSPLDPLEITVTRLVTTKKTADAVISGLWEGVVHSSALVRSASAHLLALVASVEGDSTRVHSKVVPALITLASDTDLLVKTATIPAMGTVITSCHSTDIHDKIYMQLQTFAIDSTIRENHSAMRQLTVTFGQVVNACSKQFRRDVILPHLSSLSGQLTHMANHTRKIDLAMALVEAFTNVVYDHRRANQDASILPALRCLEGVVSDNHALAAHRDTLLALIKEAEQGEVSGGIRPASVETKLESKVNQSVEEVRMRVSKIFKSNNSMQGIFNKRK